MQVLIRILIYLGSALMVYNIIRYRGVLRRVRTLFINTRCSVGSKWYFIASMR